MVAIGGFTSVKDLSAEEVRNFLADNPPESFQLVDVRTQTEYNQAHLYGASLLPVSELPDKLDELDRDKPMILYCASGNRSRAAASLLIGQGYEKVFNMKGGIKAWQGASASGPPDLGLHLFSGHETPAELTCLAYGLEEGLRVYYQTMAANSHDKETSRLFKQLAEYEDLHKDSLFGLFLSLGPAPVSRDDFENQYGGSRHMEGGFALDDYLTTLKNGNASLIAPLDLALSIEVQALDLYLRFLPMLRENDSRQIILKIVQDEKQHLMMLGKMMSKKI